MSFYHTGRHEREEARDALCHPPTTTNDVPLFARYAPE